MLQTVITWLKDLYLQLSPCKLWTRAVSMDLHIFKMKKYRSYWIRNLSLQRYFWPQKCAALMVVGERCCFISHPVNYFGFLSAQVSNIVDAIFSEFWIPFEDHKLSVEITVSKQLLLSWVYCKTRESIRNKWYHVCCWRQSKMCCEVFRAIGVDD